MNGNTQGPSDLASRGEIPIGRGDPGACDATDTRGLHEGLLTVALASTLRTSQESRQFKPVRSSAVMLGSAAILIRTFELVILDSSTQRQRRGVELSSDDPKVHP